MNEQLEDLMYRAGLTAQGCWDKMDGYDKESIEKFAELLVRECAKLADNCPADYLLQSRKYPSTYIKEHFGVEESK